MNTVDDFLSGQVLLIDKPLGWTSFQAVNKIRWVIKKKFNLKKIKVGHAGTLDPLATGLLIICTGKQTKNISTYQAQTKTYTGTITLGSTTPSYDLETAVDATFSTNHITNQLIQDTTQQFIGTIEQFPPAHSAIKKDGKRLYELARAGKAVTLEARTITINQFNIINIADNVISFKVVCSKGTYIRSLAYDFGKALNSGAHLSSLKRTQIGDYSVDNAVSIGVFLEQLS